MTVPFLRFTLPGDPIPIPRKSFESNSFLLRYLCIDSMMLGTIFFPLLEISVSIFHLFFIVPSGVIIPTFAEVPPKSIAIISFFFIFIHRHSPLYNLL